MIVRKIVFLPATLFLPLALFLFVTAINIWAQSATPDAITVWSYEDEMEDIINNYYSPAHPREKIHYSTVPEEQFQVKLDPVLASGHGAPDVFVLEEAIVRKYVESGLLLDLTDIYERNRSNLLVYPVDIATYNGRVYALSWHLCSGAMFYRRSLARKYLGTDDPAQVQRYFADFGKLLETSELLKDRSNGDCVLVASRNDLFYTFLGARKDPWVRNGRLLIDPAMEQFMGMSKTMYEKRYEGGVGLWSETWFAGMNGNIQDERGKRMEVFSYFFPNWGLHYVLKVFGPDTSGDWAMIQGPSPFYWGGTWIAAYKNTRKAAVVKDMIEWITTNDGFMERWARDTGDLVNNKTIINLIRNNYREPFLGGQNHYAEFARMAEDVNGRLSQSTDKIIESWFLEAVEYYVKGEKTKNRALVDFRRQAKDQLGL
jgi:ABC-type glycerol-3-phosphate transport system substrate-binding protein